MTITITNPGEYITNSKDEPIPGRMYALEDAQTGTGAQNRTWHALLSEYWKSGAHSYTAKSFEDFRNQIKRHLGAGFEAYVYVEIVGGKASIKDAKTYEEIPEAIRRDPDLKTLVRGRLKSWSSYSLKERKNAIDALIAEMMQVGVNTAHFMEILAGINDAKMGEKP